MHKIHASCNDTRLSWAVHFAWINKSTCSIYSMMSAVELWGNHGALELQGEVLHPLQPVPLLAVMALGLNPHVPTRGSA